MLFKQKPNEEAQLYVGQGGGLMIGTNTAHSISLSANRDVAPTTASIQISGTGSKNVFINAPLLVNSVMTCENIKSIGTPGIKFLKSDGTNALRIYDNGISQFSSNVIVDGSLTVGSFFANKPYISLRVSTSGGTPSTVDGTTVTIGTAGTASLTQLGFTTATCARGPAGQSNSFGYVFNWATPHPLGTAYSVNCTFYTPASSSPQPVGVLTATVISSTQCSVFIRATVGSVSNVLQEGNFFVNTIP